MLFHVHLVAQTDSTLYQQNINEKIDAIKCIVDISNATIANEINAVNTMLVAFTIVFGIIGVFIGWYISFLQKKVTKMSDNIAEKEQKIISLANTVEETDKKIHGDIRGLYAELRNEETMTFLHRLEEEPQDIANLSELLLARTLSSEGFSILRKAYLKLKSLGPEIYDKESLLEFSDKQKYIIMFFQHYLREAILDDDIRPDITKELKHSMTCAFKRDIIKSTEDFCMALSVNEVHFDKVSLLIDYLKALNQSKYSNLVELQQIFQERLKPDLLTDAIDKCTTDKVYLELFGVCAPNETQETDGSEIIENMVPPKEAIER